MKRPTLLCEICSQPFTPQWTSLRRGNARFCSMACRGKWMTQSKSGQNSVHWNSTEHFCETCGKSFLVNASYGQSKNARFCSRQCRKTGSIIKCLNCGKENYFERNTINAGKGKFCNMTCYAQWQSVNRCAENNFRWGGGQVERNCKQCNTVFRVDPCEVKHGRGIFCSKMCHDQWRSQNVIVEKSPSWIGGKGGYPSGWSNNLKNEIRKRDFHLCVSCGAPEAREKHHVHHIDYEKSNLDPDNLVSLCRQCHSKTNGGKETRSRWKSFFQGMMVQYG